MPSCSRTEETRRGRNVGSGGPLARARLIEPAGPGRWVHLLVFLAAFALAAGLGGCGTRGALGSGAGRPPCSGPERRISRPALGTLVEIVVREADAARARAALEASFAEIARLEALLSEWDPKSDLSRLNAAAGAGWVALSPETARALARAREVASATDGAFDPTVLPLLRLWGFAGDGEHRVPTLKEIERARARVGWRKLEVELDPPRARLLRTGMAVGLGGIGKGFIADRVLERLRARGICAALVAAGGDLAFYGGSRARPWPIAIEDPTRPGAILATLDLIEGAVSTSAPTYRHFDREGLRYHHLLDPRRGRPARGTLSVSVVASEATDSDAYATALFVMGTAAPRWLSRHSELRALILFADGRRWVSPGLALRWASPAP